MIFARDAAAHGGPLAGIAAGLAAISTAVGDEAPRVTVADRGARADGVRADGVRADGVRGDEVALVVGGDMPSLVPAVLRLLARSLAADPSLAAMTLAASGPAPLPMAVRPAAARAAIDAILAGGGRRSLLALLEAVPWGTVRRDDWLPLDPTGATLRDVDAPADLRPG